MSQLAQLQQDFQAYLLSGEPDPHFLSVIVDDDKVGAQKRIGIYHDAYRLRLIEALSTAYANTKKLLGDDFFEATTRDFIEEHPSTYRNLRWYGNEFAAHLAQALPNHAIASELAAFEWTLALAFDAEDATTKSVNDLANIAPEAWESLCFQLHPSLHLIDFSLNTVAVWQALDQDQAPPDLEVATTHWLIWREDHRPHFRSIASTEKLAIQLTQQQGSFGEICEHLYENGIENPVELAAGILSGWLKDGLVSALSHQQD